MILLIGFYEDANTSRRAEFLECIRRNAANDRIDEIHLFVEEALALARWPTRWPTWGRTTARVLCSRGGPA
jgi:hypothetical protein